MKNSFALGFQAYPPCTLRLSSRNLLAFVYPIIPDHACHTQTIVRKNFLPTLGLRHPMLICGAPIS